MGWWQNINHGKFRSWCSSHVFPFLSPQFAQNKLNCATHQPATTTIKAFLSQPPLVCIPQSPSFVSKNSVSFVCCPAAMRRVHAVHLKERELEFKLALIIPAQCCMKYGWLSVCLFQKVSLIVRHTRCRKGGLTHVWPSLKHFETYSDLQTVLFGSCAAAGISPVSLMDSLQSDVLCNDKQSANNNWEIHTSLSVQLNYEWIWFTLPASGLLALFLTY